MIKHKIGIILIAAAVFVSGFMQSYPLCASAAENEVPVTVIEEDSEQGAETVIEEDPEQEAEVVIEEDPAATSSVSGQSTGTNDDGRTADELFEGYIRKEFGIDAGGAGKGAEKAQLRKAGAGARLTGMERNAYVRISEVLPLIASGERASTVISVSIDDLFEGCKNSWTAKELGVSSLLERSASSPTGWAVTEEALTAMEEKGELDLYKILVALLADHPYELYWFNKIAGFYMDDLDVTANEDHISFTGEAFFRFTVEKEYAAGQYEVNTKFGAAVRTSVQNAEGIVERCGDYSDYDKLRAYKDEICRLVEYDDAALTDTASYGKPPYGNPWQLIWVFDGDPATNVVCEGYAKAFQYLCDRSGFDADISCLTVNGKTDENHMWNIVRMDDGANYLVDLTNCDEDSCGYPDRLFLAGTAGSPDHGYHFDIDLYNYIAYSYDKLIRDYYDDSELRLAGSDYGKGKSVSAASVTLDRTEFTYDGTRKLPAVTVILDGAVLVEGRDYDLEYAENINAGAGTIAVTGTGSYSGVKRVQFAILKADLPAATKKLNAVNLATGMSVVWAAVPGADGYILTRSCGTVSQNIRIKGGSTLNYTDRAANADGKKYTYKIAATAGNVTSTSVRTVSRIRVPRPEISSVTNSAAGKMTVKWRKDKKTAGHQVQYSLRSDFGTFRTVTVDSASAVSKTISGLRRSKTYYVRIRSYRMDGKTRNYSAFSKVRKVTVIR